MEEAFSGHFNRHQWNKLMKPSTNTKEATITYKNLFCSKTYGKSNKTIHIIGSQNILGSKASALMHKPARGTAKTKAKSQKTPLKEDLASVFILELSVCNMI
ncbi:MAG: hypothetical protein IKR71_09985 [Bacteroidales bacterium]|nr:hypothetical protein [Bacteroidales bacterium]